MAQSHRTTVYLTPQLHRALKLKAAETDQTLSELINRAVQAALAEDLEDLEALRKRGKEPARKFEDFLKELKSAGEL